MVASEDYVDHVLSANLDSTFAFEGPEKLLEVWFWPSPKDAPGENGLRKVPLAKWVSVLDLVSCKVLSVKSSRDVDAYLLSESSLFVFPHKLVLKTCGTTTTLACLDLLFKVAQAELLCEINSKDVHQVFYSRRSFMFPEKQKHVHTDWKKEVQLLNGYFVQGKSYVVGDFTSDDHWYLYMGGRQEGSPVGGQDQTFEILMTQLDPQRARAFVTSREPGPDSVVTHSSDEEEHDLGHDQGLETMRDTGLENVFLPASTAYAQGNFAPSTTSPFHIPSPQMSENMELSDEEDDKWEFAHDAFAFSPCGYSSNSVCSKNGHGYYYTLHITPESGWSYASFETNYPFSATSPVGIVDVLIRVLRIFHPGKFSMTLVNEKAPEEAACFTQLASCADAVAKLGYAKQEKVTYDLKGAYDLLYLNFEKSIS
ncbi:S-adenosylmethionine decarboxylase proenzyme [Candidozyma duobushaemuli]|uniref:adenosylmethionine decarboxylase n=2 Tax=Candidozyma TaxID=3303203 RepID=A0ABX8I2G2_9ASCO|nr:S-adenosylmethionine decarboxylase proenzyme [[Candida] duobushaemulonis]PVH14385.1 S-adenosylmethionine decarboxylase proenzyme [[Candida] duobushaemulonis]QWU87441.1 hypothetical protein CA3LBN_001706 [[Candida] haemuloni]